MLFFIMLFLVIGFLIGLLTNNECLSENPNPLKLEACNPI